jgi:hypothetical protein
LIEDPRIVLSRPEGIYEPGEIVEVRVEFDPQGTPPGDAELMALWYSEGKGDTDAGISDSRSFRLAGPPGQTFRLKLGELPWTYHGHLIKLHWVIRLRVSGMEGRDDTLVDAPIEVRPSKSE